MSNYTLLQTMAEKCESSANLQEKYTVRELLLAADVLQKGNGQNPYVRNILP